MQCSNTRPNSRSALCVDRQARSSLVAARAGRRESSTSVKELAYEGADDIIFGDGRNVEGESSGKTSSIHGPGPFGVRFQPDFTDIVSCVQLSEDENPWSEIERIEELRDMTKKSLQATCRKQGLKIQGGRDELIARIIAHESSHPESVKADTSAPLIKDIFVGLA